MIYRIPVMMEREWTVFAKTHLNIALTDDEKEPFSLTKPGITMSKMWKFGKALAEYTRAELYFIEGSMS